MQNQTVNGDLKDSLVVCTSRDGHEVRGRLVKLTRHAVAFEVFSHSGDGLLSPWFSPSKKKKLLLS